MELAVKDGTGKVLMSLTAAEAMPVAEILAGVAQELGIAQDSIVLLGSNDIPIDVGRLFSHYGCPSTLTLVTKTWFSYYSTEHSAHYYYDPSTKKSSWELPLSAKSIPGPAEHSLALFTPTEKHCKYSHLIQTDFLEGENYMNRPARKQLDEPFLRNYAYQQGDDEYNIWYDKYPNDKPVKEREPAATRCDPEQDIGYTKADKFEAETSYWCLHFARGCCTEGANCRFAHHLPNWADCQRIDPMKDLFGRTRHAKHREDMGGIGCFQKESRTLAVCEVKLPPGNDPVEQVNEMLWRHFSLWGRIQDITFIPSKCLAFVKYYHRCCAELAKEAMNRQSLDYDEMLSIKWANDDSDPMKEAQYSEAWHKAQIKNEREMKGEKFVKAQKKHKEVREIELPKKLPPPVNVSELEETLAEEERVKKNAKRMEGVLKRIHQEDASVLPEVIFPANLERFDR